MLTTCRGLCGQRPAPRGWAPPFPRADYLPDVVTTVAGFCILSSACSCLLPRNRDARWAGSCAPLPPGYRMRTRTRSSPIEPETGQGRAPVPEVPAHVQLTDVPPVGQPELDTRIERHPHP